MQLAQCLLPKHWKCTKGPIASLSLYYSIRILSLSSNNIRSFTALKLTVPSFTFTSISDFLSSVNSLSYNVLTCFFKYLNKCLIWKIIHLTQKSKISYLIFFIFFINMYIYTYLTTGSVY